MTFARITGTGSYLPGSPISNDELIARHGLESSGSWIEERTGIRNRHFAPASIASSDLAVHAASRALAAANRRADEVDLIIVATSTPDRVFPSVAALLQRKLGMTNKCPAFDLQAVCSGFSYALAVANKFIRSGDHRCVLVVGAEVFSRILDWGDRRTCVLFGDGSGAVVLEASDKPGILADAIHADGSQSEILCVPGQLHGGAVIGDPFIRMDGQAVFKYAVKVLSQVIDETLARAGMVARDVDLLIAHQANIRIIQATARKLGLDDEQCVITVADHGNTSAASIPLALDVAVSSGRLLPGMTLLLAGVGGGFTWGANLITY